MLNFNITENYFLNIMVNTTLISREDRRRYLFEGGFGTLLRLVHEIF